MISHLDIKKLASIFLALGGLITGVAVLWWLYFFGPMIVKTQNIGEFISCLYSSTGNCTFLIVGSVFSGRDLPYRPVVFLVGLLLIAVGVIIKVTLKQKSAEE